MERKLKSYQIKKEVVTLILTDDSFLESTKSKRNKELRQLIEERFGVQSRQAQRYIKDARKEVEELKEKDKDYFFHRAIRRRDLYITKCINKKDYRTALRADDSLCKLLDLFPDQRIKSENTNYDIDLTKLTKKGLKRIARGDDPREVMMDPESVRGVADD